MSVTLFFLLFAPCLFGTIYAFPERCKDKEKLMALSSVLTGVYWILQVFVVWYKYITILSFGICPLKMCA